MVEFDEDSPILVLYLVVTRRYPVALRGAVEYPRPARRPFGQEVVPKDIVIIATV